MITAEKKEQVLQSFREAFDKKMAYRKVGLQLSEQDELDKDEEFQLRMELLLIQEKENTIRKLRNFSMSENEQVAFKATTELGKILYPEFFDNLKEPPVTVNVNMLSKEEEERLDKEYEILFGEKNYKRKHDRSESTED